MFPGEAYQTPGCARALVTQPGGLSIAWKARQAVTVLRLQRPATLYPVPVHTWDLGGLPAGPPKTDLEGRQHLL